MTDLNLLASSWFFLQVNAKYSNLLVLVMKFGRESTVQVSEQTKSQEDTPTAGADTQKAGRGVPKAGVNSRAGEGTPCLHAVGQSIRDNSLVLVRTPF